LPAGLGLAVARTLAGGAERRRAYPLAGIVLARATGKASVAGRIRQPQLADRDIALTGSGSGSADKSQRQHGTQHKLRENLRLRLDIPVLTRLLDANQSPSRI
jgi:hypothetical protein